MLGDIDNKVIADFACGPGYLGIGALLLGAKWVHFVDIDPKALELTRKNLSILDEYEIKRNAHLMESDITASSYRLGVLPTYSHESLTAAARSKPGASSESSFSTASYTSGRFAIVVSTGFAAV